MSRSLRIAMIGQRGIPATFGGIEHHVEQLGARLVERGHEVIVFCRPNYGDRRMASHRGMRLHHLPTVGTKYLDALVHSALATAAAMRERFDIFHYHALGPGALAVLPRYTSRAKVVLTVHGLDSERAKWGCMARSALRMAGWLSARIPDATIVVSRDLERHYHEVHGCRAVYVPNGVVAPEPHVAGPVLSRLGLQPNRYLLFVGRLVPEKAPDLLLRAFRQVTTDHRLVLAGGSSFTNTYAKRIGDLATNDPRVMLPGYLFGAELGELYANAAAFVLPSLLEGLPLTLLEAASFSTPVIASAIPPHLEIIGTSGQGSRLVTPGDEGELAAALALVLADPEGERRGAARLKDRVLDAYDWQAVTDTTEDVYQQVMTATTAAPLPGNSHATGDGRGIRHSSS